MMRWILKILVVGLFAVVLAATAGMLWLRSDASRPLDAYFTERQGTLLAGEVAERSEDPGQVSEFLTLTSDSGLAVRARVIRGNVPDKRLPVLVILGGHRTGSDAVDLFGRVGERAIVALDYPYDGPEKVRGVRQTLETLPLARQAFIDTPPAVSLTIDWLTMQPWADPDQITIVGASLGVPFATLAAARDPRIDGAVLVHGAADNLEWIEVQVARRNDNPFVIALFTRLVFWAAYAPSFNTAEHVARIAPRPVIIVGAREDERTPPTQIEALFAAAGNPKVLRWTSGQHVETDRPEVIAELLTIAEDVFSMPATNR